MSSEQLTESISSIQRLRTSVNALLESTYRRKPDRTQIQKMHRDMKLSMRDCSYISLINLPPTVVNFWDTSMLAVEVDDGLQLYKSLNFLDQVREKSSLFSSLLIDNSLERKHPKAGHDVEMPLSVFDPVIISFNRNYPLLNVSRLSTTLLHVSVRHVLNTSLTIINMKLEWITVLGIEEEDSSLVDINLSQSRHKVFQVIQNQAQGAMLYFSSPDQPMQAFEDFITWVASYSTLFTAKCRGCGLHLKNFLPPTCRKFKNFMEYHIECQD